MIAQSLPTDATNVESSNTRVGWVRGRGWGWTWGPGDEVGALNTLGPGDVLSALQRVERGTVFDLGVLVDRDSFLSPVHPHTEVLAFRTPEGTKRQADLPFMDPRSNTTGLGFMSNVITISDHAGTQIDGLAHVTVDDDNHWYNGFRTSDWGSDFGPRKAGAETTPPIVVTGHLLDAAGAAGVTVLPERTPIGPELIEAAIARQELAISPGEAVFIRTGSLSRWGEAGHDHNALRGGDASGLNLAGARYLVEELGSVLVGSDTSMVEVFPAVDGPSWHPVHKYLLIDQGVHMGELHYLEDLVAAGVSTFCYVALVPKLRGITGGFAMRPIAIV